MREWKPGDVALLMTEGGERVGFRCGVPTNMGWQYAREVGQNTWSSDDYVKPIRPLVVIDPKDREQVERLTELLRRHMTHVGGFGPDGYTLDEVTAALREFADPKPSKPEEPTGLGAVVEDKWGHRFVRTGWPEAPWCNVNEESSCTWDHVDVDAVLSEGVTP